MEILKCFKMAAQGPECRVDLLKGCGKHDRER